MKKLFTISALLSLFVIISVAAGQAGASEVTGTLSSGVQGASQSTGGTISGSVEGGSTGGGGGSSGGGSSGGGTGFGGAPAGQVLGAATAADPGFYPSFPDTGKAK